jgi:hypothetical protein
MILVLPHLLAIALIRQSSKAYDEYLHLLGSQT